MQYPGFLGPAYQSASVLAGRERLINLYLEKNETPNAPSPYVLLNTPGFTEAAPVSEGPIRGIGVAGTRVFFVAGYLLYELTYDATAGTFTATARGTLSADTNPATLCWNGPNGGQLFITSGDVGYCYVLATNALSTVLASGATMGAFLDGYFLALDAATATLQISDLFDGLTWDPTQVAQRSAAADPWVAMTVIHGDIWLQGAYTSEVWTNTGASPFPFALIPGAVIESGTAAPFSAIRDTSPLVWVSQNAQGAREIRMAQGYTAQRISTHGVEYPLSTYDTVSDAISFGYQDVGHTFVVIVFPSANAAWCYDATEGAWHERLYWNTQTAEWNALRVAYHAQAWGFHLVGDRGAGTIYVMATDAYTDVDGAAILRERTTPRLSANQKRITVARIQLVADVGVGLNGDQASQDVDPQAMLQTSGDGGQTFGSMRLRTLGKIGTYGTRVTWDRCGMARNRVDRFRFSAAVPIRIAEAEIDLSVGAS